MRPDKQLAPLLGVADTGATLANGYMRIDTGRPPGAGVTGATMQYHDVADRYALAGATAVAPYSDADAGAGVQPDPLHRLQRLVERAERRAGARHPARRQLLLARDVAC